MDRRHKEGFWLTILQVNHLFLVDHCKVHGRAVEVHYKAVARQPFGLKSVIKT